MIPIVYILTGFFACVALYVAAPLVIGLVGTAKGLF